MSKKSQVDTQSSLAFAGVKGAANGFQTRSRHNESDLWELENRDALKQYAQRIEKDGTAAEQLDRFLARHPEVLINKSRSAC